MKHRIAKLVSLALALIMACALFACTAAAKPAAANDPAPAATAEPQKTEPKAEPAAPQSFQLLGRYFEEGQGADRLNAAFKLDLNEDGTAVCDRYRFMAGNVDDAASNPTYDDSFMTGTWKAVTKDGIDSLQIKLACKDDAGNETNAQTIYANEVVGSYTVDLEFPIVIGMDYKRTVTLEGTAEKQFADDNGFIAANKYEAPAEPAAEPEPAKEPEPAQEPEPADPTGTAAKPEGDCPFAGDYDVEYTTGDGNKSYFEEFVIEADWTVHGIVESSGLTGFEGTVDADGVITATIPRLEGTLNGVVDADGNVTGGCEVRGRTSTFEGARY